MPSSEKITQKVKLKEIKNRIAGNWESPRPAWWVIGFNCSINNQSLGFASSGTAVVLWQLRCVSFAWLLTTRKNVVQSGANGNARLPLGAAHHDLSTSLELLRVQWSSKLMLRSPNAVTILKFFSFNLIFRFWFTTRGRNFQMLRDKKNFEIHWPK